MGQERINVQGEQNGATAFAHFCHCYCCLWTVNHSPLVVGFLSRSHPYLLVVCRCFHVDALYPLLFTKPEIELVLLPERWTSPFLLKTKQNQKKAKHYSSEILFDPVLLSHSHLTCQLVPKSYKSFFGKSFFYGPHLGPGVLEE